MANICDTGRNNACGQPMFHLRRIGPAATKPGVASIMDFQRVTYMIGRNAAKVDFLLDSSNYMQGASLSRCHARVVRQTGNQHKLYDDSLNGVFVNNIKIAGSCILREGDKVTFGHPAGVKFPPGSRVRQPDSEHQFMFERCTCPVASYSSTRASPSLPASRVTETGFKVPQISPTEKSRVKRNTRNITQSFTMEDVRNLKQEFEEKQAAKSETMAASKQDVNCQENGREVAETDDTNVKPTSAVPDDKDEMNAETNASEQPVDVFDRDSSNRNLNDQVVAENQKLETEEKQLAQNDTNISQETSMELEENLLNQDNNKMSDTSDRGKERETESHSFNSQLEGTMKSIMDVLNELKDTDSNHTDTNSPSAPSSSTASAGLISNEAKCNTILKTSPSKDASIQTSQIDTCVKANKWSPTKDACIQTSQAINKCGDKPVNENLELDTELLFENDNSENANNSDDTTANITEIKEGEKASSGCIEGQDNGNMNTGESGTGDTGDSDTGDIAMETTDNVQAVGGDRTESSSSDIKCEAGKMDSTESSSSDIKCGAGKMVRTGNSSLDIECETEKMDRTESSSSDIKCGAEKMDRAESSSLDIECETEKIDLHHAPEIMGAQMDGHGESDQMDINETDSKLPEVEESHSEHINEPEQTISTHEQSGSYSTGNSEQTDELADGKCVLEDNSDEMVRSDINTELTGEKDIYSEVFETNNTEELEKSGNVCGSDETKLEVLVSESDEDTLNHMASCNSDSESSENRESCSIDMAENEQIVAEMENIASIADSEEKPLDAKSENVKENNLVESFEMEEKEVVAKMSTGLCADKSASLCADENAFEVIDSQAEKDTVNQVIRSESDSKSPSENHPVETAEPERIIASPEISVGACGDGKKIDDIDNRSDATETEINHSDINKDAETEIRHVGLGKDAKHECCLNSEVETIDIGKALVSQECSAVENHDEVCEIKDEDSESNDEFECVVVSKQHTDTLENASNESLRNNEDMIEATDKSDLVLSDSMEYDLPEVGAETGGLILSDSIEYEYDAESDGDFQIEVESDSEELQNEGCKTVNADKYSDTPDEVAENDQPISNIMCQRRSLENGDEDMNDCSDDVKHKSNIEEINDNRMNFTENDITGDADNKEEVVHTESSRDALNTEEETQRYSDSESDCLPNNEPVEADSKQENDVISDFNEETSESVVEDHTTEECRIDNEDNALPQNFTKDNNMLVNQSGEKVGIKNEEGTQSNMAVKEIGSTGVAGSGNRKRKMPEETEVEDEIIGKRHCNYKGKKYKSIKKKLASLFDTKQSDSSNSKCDISKVESMKQAVKSFFKSRSTKKSYNVEKESAGCIYVQDEQGTYKSLALESPETAFNIKESDDESNEMKVDIDLTESNAVERVMNEIECKVENSENKILANDCQLSTEENLQSISDIAEDVSSHVENDQVVEDHCINESETADTMETVCEEKTFESVSNSPELIVADGNAGVPEFAQDSEQKKQLGLDENEKVDTSNDEDNVEDIDEIPSSPTQTGDNGSSDDLVNASVSYTDDDIKSDEILERKLMEMPVTPEKSSDNSEPQMSPMIRKISTTGAVVSPSQSPIIAKQLKQRNQSSETKVDELSCEFSDEEDNFISPEIDFSHFDDDNDDDDDDDDELAMGEEMESDIEKVEEEESVMDEDDWEEDEFADEVGTDEGMDSTVTVESDKGMDSTVTVESDEEDEMVDDDDRTDVNTAVDTANSSLNKTSENDDIQIDSDIIQPNDCDEVTVVIDSDEENEIPLHFSEENEIPLHFSEELDAGEGDVNERMEENTAEKWAIKIESEPLESREDKLTTKPAVKRKCTFDEASTPKRKSPDNMDTPEKDTNSKCVVDNFKMPTSVRKLQESVHNDSYMESPCDFSSTQLMESSHTPEIDRLSESQISRVSEQLERKMNDPTKPSTSRSKAKDLIAKLRARKEIKKEAIIPSSSPSSSQGSDRETAAHSTDGPEQTAAVMRLGEVDKQVNRCRKVIGVMKKSFDKHIALRDNPRVQAWRQELSEVEKKLLFPKTVIAVVGDTGAGKSSLMNAILDQRSILPTSGMRACTAVVVEVVQNTSSSTTFEADIEFLQKKEWFDELHILLKDLTGLDGTVKNRPPDPTSDAYVSYCKIRAVYGKIDSFQVLSRYSNVTHWLGKVKVLRATDPESFRRQVEKYIETQDPGAGGQYWPIVKHVRLRLPNCDVCSSGAALVDLPGVRDSNAARDKIAREYLKNCTAVWVVSSIHRAIDDKTAKDLLGENFRRQLLMDGQYGSIAFICTKTDILMPSEIIRPLKLEDETKEHENRILDMEQQKTELDLDIAGHLKEIRRLTRTVETLQEEAQELRDNLTEISALLEEPGDRESQQTEEHEALKEYEEELSDKEGQIKEAERRINTLLTDKQEAGQQTLELEKKLTVHRKAIAAICAKARNEYSKSQIKRDFKAGLREMKRRAGMLGTGADDEEEEEDDDDDDDEDIGSTADNLHVFCCSSTEYQKMKNLLTDDGPPQVFSSVADTQIPELRNYVHEMTSMRRLQAVERMIRGLGRFVFDLQSYTADGEYVTKGARSNAKSTIDGQLHRFDATVAPVLQELSAGIDSVFDGSIRSKMQEGSANATNEASSTCAKWGAPYIRDKTKDKRDGGLHFMTYKATVRRQGVYTSPTFGPVNFNEDLSEPMYRSMTIVWDKAFSGMLWKILDKVKAQILERLRAFTSDLVTQLHKLGVPKDRSSRVSSQLHGSAANKLSEMVNQLKEIVTNKQRDISRLVTPHIQTALAPTYDVSAAESGSGMYNRIKGHMGSAIEGKRMTMFDEATEELMQALMELQTEVIDFVRRVCTSLMQDLRAAFEPLWEAPSNYKVLRAAFLKPITEACSEVRQMYSDAGLRNTEEEAVMPVATDTAGPSTSAAVSTGSSLRGSGEVIYRREVTQGIGVNVKTEPSNYGNPSTSASPGLVGGHVVVKQEPFQSTAAGVDTSLTTFGDQTLEDLRNGKLEICPVQVSMATQPLPQPQLSRVTILQTGQTVTVSGIPSVNQSALSTQTGSPRVHGSQTSLLSGINYKPVISAAVAAQASPASNIGIVKVLPGGKKVVEPCQLRILSSGQKILQPVSTVTSDARSKAMPTLTIKREKSGTIDSFFTSPKSVSSPNPGKENSTVGVMAGPSQVKTGSLFTPSPSAAKNKGTGESSRKKKGTGKVSLSRSNKGNVPHSAVTGSVTIKSEPVDSGHGKRQRPKNLGHIDLTELDSD